jgi:hypothetical protein
MENLPAQAMPPTKPNGSLTSYAPGNVRAALKERMIFSDALERVGAMLKSYPPSEGIEMSGYIGTLAAALMQYPPCVSIRCADPIKGVAATTRFKPTVADLIAWCEREVASLREIVGREDCDRAQVEQRRRDAKLEAELAAARATRPTLEELRAKHGPHWGLKSMDGEVSDAEIPKADASQDGKILEEYRQLGREPIYAWGRPMSPSLLKALGKIPEREAAE